MPNRSLMGKGKYRESNQVFFTRRVIHACILLKIFCDKQTLLTDISTKIKISKVPGESSTLAFISDMIVRHLITLPVLSFILEPKKVMRILL